MENGHEPRRYRRSQASEQAHPGFPASPPGKCRICNQEHREAIESRFLLWENAHDIVEEFGLGHRSLLYRHAKATGLLDQRKENFTSVLDSIVERCDGAQVTGATILLAIRAYSCLKAHGRWVDPPRRHSVKRIKKTLAPLQNPNRDIAIKNASSR
jgi:hypothetical protein